MSNPFFKSKRMPFEAYINKVQPIIDELNKDGIPEQDFTDVIYIDPQTNEKLQFVDLVQEGGGVLGIALVGYVYVLEKMGIRFLSLGGTSAGSINTILLASLGTPEQMKSEKILKILANKDFSDFIDCSPIEKIILWMSTRPNKWYNYIFLKIAQFLFSVYSIFKVSFYKGICPGNHFEQWLKSILENSDNANRNPILNVSDLLTQMNTIPKPLKKRFKNIRAELAIIAADTTTGTKAIFPKMSNLYFRASKENLSDNNYDGLLVKPYEFVRASMSIPLLFAPKKFKAPKYWNKKEWKEEVGFNGKEIPEEFVFVDGGVMSNFPIDVFHVKDSIPTRPTFGIRLGEKKTSFSTNKGGFKALFSALNSTRSLRDFEFLHENEEYQLLVSEISIESKEFNWIDFYMSEEKKLALFEKGAEAAKLFLHNFNWDEYKDIRKEIMFNSSASHLVNLSKKSDIFSKFGLSNQSPVIDLVNTAMEKLDDRYKKIAQKYIRDVKEDFQIVEDYIRDENEVVVLWVDDEPFNDIFEISLLKLFNISYEIASSTQEAIKILKIKKEICLVISDCYRSDSIKDAFDLCDKIYSDTNIQDVPIIFHSNSELASTDEILQNIDALKKKHEHNKHLIHYNYSSIQELIKGIGEILSEQIKDGKIIQNG